MKATPTFFAVLTISCALATAWTVRVDSAAASNKTIKFAYVGAPTDARHQTALKLKEWIEAKSGGSLTVALYSGGQLGGDRDAIEGIQLGTIEMTVAGAGIFANFEPQMAVTALPYLFDSFEQAWSFDDGEINARICGKLPAQGIRVLGFWDNGFRCITNSVHPIQTPDDLVGLKIRTPENPVVMATIAALGGNPSPLPWTELYMALQQGAFDGQENPIPTIYVNKLYETQQYLALTDHIYEPMPVVVSESFWQRLSLREQQSLQEAVSESQSYNRRLVQQMTRDMLVKLEQAGMKITRPDRSVFRARTAEVREHFRNVLGADMVDQIESESR